MEKRKSLILFLIFLFLAVNFSAQEVGKRFNITTNDEPMSSVFKKIGKASGVRVEFAYEDVNPYRVTISLKDVTAVQAVKAVVADYPLTYSIKADGKFIIISRLHRVIQQPKRTLQKGHNATIIHGRVVDASNSPLPGVNVTMKSNGSGMTTDGNGNYIIYLEKGTKETLIFSFIGMKTTSFTINADSEEKLLNVTLKENANELGEVVVTGMFNKSRESYTGSVNTVNKEQLKIFKGQNLLQTLRNVDASLNISLNNLSGSNPNALPQMNIRGTSSLPTSVNELNQSTKQSVNMPLIIMDGFEITLTKLMDYNDEEIESITVLKDASATAIYGSRGANGVIVVKTKNPEVGKLRLTAEFGFTAEVPDLGSYSLLNATDKLELERSIGLYESTDPTRTVEYQEQYYKRLKDVLSGVNTDWLSQPLHTGLGQRYNLRLEGGSNEFRWGTALSYKDTQGAMKGSSRKVFDGSVTLMYTYKQLTFRNNTDISNTKSANSPYGNFSNYVQQQPYNRIYDDNGHLIRYFSGFYADSNKTQNPLYDATLNTFDKSNALTIINNFAIDWNILPELVLRGQFGVTVNKSTSDLFYPPEHSMFSDVSVYPVGSSRKGSYTYGTGDGFSYDGRMTLSYSKTFNKIHQLYAGFDYSISENHNKNYSFKAEGFTNQKLSFIGNALQYAEGSSPTADQTKSRRVGFTGNLNYTFDNRYYIDGSFRMDGSSQFGSNKRFAPFWSLGIGWNLHREKFITTLKFINTLRLRASLGETGSMDFSKSDVLTMYKYTSGERYDLWNSAHLQGLGNSNLTWQKTDEKNIGLDFRLFDNRIFGSFDYYSKITNGLVSARDIPLSMGFSSYSENVGKVKNNGYEISLGVYLIRDLKHEFSWLINGQLVYNKNRVSKLSDAIKKQNEQYVASGSLSDSEPAYLLYEGRPQYGIYAVRSLGIDPASGEEIYLDRDGKITNTWNTKDRVYCGEDGTYSSPYRGNMSTMIRWKNITLNLSCGYQWGGKLYNATLRDRVEVTTRNIQYYNVDKRVFTERWQKPGDKVFFKKIETYGTEEYRTKATSRFVMDNKWFEIQSLGLQYRWSTPELKRITGCQTILFGFNMNDLWHFSSVKYERGTSYPFSRNIQGSISLIF